MCFGQRHLPEQLQGEQVLGRPREAGLAPSGSREPSCLPVNALGLASWEIREQREGALGFQARQRGPAEHLAADGPAQSRRRPRLACTLLRNDKHVLFRDAEFCNPVLCCECQPILR